MNFDELKKYLTFVGTASRSEYWGVYIASWFILIVASLIFFIFSLTGILGVILGSVSLILVSALLILMLVSTFVRRCRDADINPLFALGLLIPYINFFLFIIVGFLEPRKDNGSAS